MKLRQKLAVVLASAMVVTAVPVVTMAASTNSLSQETLKVKKDNIFQGSTAPQLKIEFKDSTPKSTEVFYLQLTNAKWDEDTIKAATLTGFTYEKQSDTVLKVTATVNDSKVMSFPILAKATGGDATVEIVTMGGTTVSKGSYLFATTAEKKMSVSAGDVKTFYSKGKIADITIEEPFKGALAEGGEFTIDLADSDFQFTGSLEKVEYKYGFKTGIVTVSVDSKDSGKLHVVVGKMTGDTIGQIVLKGIEVKSTDKKPTEGDFLVDFKSVDDSLVAEKSDVKVAKVSQYGTYLTMKDDKAVDVKAGRIKEITYSVGENVENSMITGRDFDMTLENGHFNYKKLVDDAKTAGKCTYALPTAPGDDDYKKAAAIIDSKWLATKILDNDSDWASTGKVCEAAFDVDKDGKAITNTITFTVGEDKKNAATQTNTECDKLTFKLDVCVPVDNKDKEAVKLSVSGRGIETDASVTAINILNPIDVTFEQAVLKTGLQGQVSGSITLTEKDKDMLQKGDLVFKVKKDNETYNIYLTDATVEASDGLKGTKTTVDKGNTTSAAQIKVTLNRVSNAASTVTIKDMKFTTDRTVPEGTYDLEISGSALDADGHKLTVKDFIKISTANTETLTTANGLAKGTASFAIGESKFVSNGKEVTMDAASYIQDPGYTMVPVRYVAGAFGVAESDILFGKGVVTIFAGNRTVALEAGSDIAIVNGAPVTLSTPVVIKEGRTYAPIGEIAKILGVSSKWDSATKTASFENK